MKGKTEVVEIENVTVDEVAAIGKMAYARGTWTVEPTAAAGDDAPTMTGKWSAIYKRGPDGGWQTWRWRTIRAGRWVNTCAPWACGR